MTREEYLDKRKNAKEIVYIYYLEHFNDQKHRPLLHKNEFFQALSQWGNPNIIVDRVLTHYDQKFEVSILTDKEGKTIGWL